jgi:hypothetical protein
MFTGDPPKLRGIDGQIHIDHSFLSDKLPYPFPKCLDRFLVIKLLSFFSRRRPTPQRDEED